MPAYFLKETDLINKNTIFLKNKDTVHHLKDVLRIKESEEVKFFNGKSVFMTSLDIIKNSEIVFKIRKEENIPDINPVIHLYQSLIPLDKIELVLHLNIPLGIFNFHFVKTHYSQLKSDTFLKKKNRIQKIALNIAEQSEVMRIPDIQDVIPLKELKLKAKEDHLIIALNPGSDKTFKEFILNSPSFKEVSIFVGPEGGFSRDDLETLKQFGVVFLSFSGGIFRSELAGFLSCSILRLLWGNL